MYGFNLASSEYDSLNRCFLWVFFCAEDGDVCVNILGAPSPCQGLSLLIIPDFLHISKPAAIAKLCQIEAINLNGSDFSEGNWKRRLRPRISNLGEEFNILHVNLMEALSYL